MRFASVDWFKYLRAFRFPASGVVADSAQPGHLNLTHWGDTKASKRRDVTCMRNVNLNGKTRYETVWFQLVWTGDQGRLCRRCTDVVAVGGPWPIGPVCRFRRSMVVQRHRCTFRRNDRAHQMQGRL